jgi:hypothetical protein
LARSHPGKAFSKALVFAAALLALGGFLVQPAAAADWEELPVVPVLDPGVARHLEKIVSRGEGYGNNPGVFAKIGDSITASPSFLQALACHPPQLGAWSGLRGTLEFFGETAVPRGYEEPQCAVSNSFSRLGAAAVGGWRVVDALGPRESLPECQGLPALTCELRTLRPSVALIMFGTNDLEEFTAVQFRRDLARLARLVSSAGTIPVLSTIPPRVQRPFTLRVLRFNAEIAALAENRALPLWNFWRQLTKPGVPAWGLSRDGVHPSALCPPCTAIDFRPAGLRYGYALRNLGALRVLDRLRRTVLLE